VRSGRGIRHTTSPCMWKWSMFPRSRSPTRSSASACLACALCAGTSVRCCTLRTLPLNSNGVLAEHHSVEFPPILPRHPSPPSSLPPSPFPRWLVSPASSKQRTRNNAGIIQYGGARAPCWCGRFGCKAREGTHARCAGPLSCQRTCRKRTGMKSRPSL
jgi:hypothetical protein